jgi:hypothetical protein
MQKLLKSLAKRSNPIVGLVAICLITWGVAGWSGYAAMVTAGMLLWVDVNLMKTRGRHGRHS